MKRCRNWGERERGILAAVFVGGMLAGGCSSNHLLGDVGAGGATGDASSSGLGGQAAPRFAGPFDAGFPGDVSPLGATSSWTGYIENYQLPSGSDVVKLSFAFDPTGVLVGNVTFGTAAPLASPTDPNVGYPPGAVNPLLPIASAPAEGFAYTMAFGTLESSRLRFQIWLPELWSAWCALQAPVPGSDSCLPNWQSDVSADGTTCHQLEPGTQRSIAVDCGKLELCSLARVCVCSSTGCLATLDTDAIQFDMALTANSADGSITGRIGDHNIRLTLNP